MSLHQMGAGWWGDGRAAVALLVAVVLSGLVIGCGENGADELSCPDGRILSVGALQNPDAGVDNASDALAFIDVPDRPGGEVGISAGTFGVIGSWEASEYTAERATFVFRQLHGVTAVAEVVNVESGWVLAGVTACGFLVDASAP